MKAEPGTMYMVGGYRQSKGNIKGRNRHAKRDTAHKQRKIICFNLEEVLYKSITRNVGKFAIYKLVVIAERCPVVIDISQAHSGQSSHNTKPNMTVYLIKAMSCFGN